MYKIIFTLDYEIHGNGSGSPKSLIIDPTERLLDLFDKYGAKLTIMADVGEILKFKEYFDESGRDDLNYSEIVEQLKDAIRRGHDVQLHMHSSYLKAKYINGAWEQYFPEYHLAGLEYDRINEIIKMGKDFLQEILSSSKSDYRCIAFRAAGWSMQPSQNIISALINNGINVDTSVFKYGKRFGLSNFDYTLAHSALIPYPVDTRDICRRDPKGELIEFPIYCEKRKIGAFLSLNRIYRAIKQKFNPLPAGVADFSNVERNKKTSRLSKALTFITKTHPWKLDFNQASGRQLIRGIKRIKMKYDSEKRDIPIVLIGHSKLFTKINEVSLQPFLKYVSKRKNEYSFGTFSDFDLNTFKD